MHQLMSLRRRQGPGLLGGILLWQQVDEFRRSNGDLAGGEDVWLGGGWFGVVWARGLLGYTVAFRG
jgi:hypothetical protein